MAIAVLSMPYMEKRVLKNLSHFYGPVMGGAWQSFGPSYAVETFYDCQSKYETPVVPELASCWNMRAWRRSPFRVTYLTMSHEKDLLFDDYQAIQLNVYQSPQSYYSSWLMADSKGVKSGSVGAKASVRGPSPEYRNATLTFQEEGNTEELVVEFMLPNDRQEYKRYVDKNWDGVFDSVEGNDDGNTDRAF